MPLSSHFLSSSTYLMDEINELSFPPFSATSVLFISKAFMEHFSKSFLRPSKPHSKYHIYVQTQSSATIKYYVKGYGRPTTASILGQLNAQATGVVF